jgi:hypothetical protein
MKTTGARASTTAIVALAAAAIFFAAALARAVAVDPSPAGDVTGPDPVLEPTNDPPVPPIDASSPLTIDAVRLAADTDPFQPDRQRAERYILPGERRLAVEEPEAPPPAPPFRLVGTAVVGEGGLAVVTLDTNDPPRLLQIGDFLEGYRLTRVQPFGATMEGQGRSLDLHVTAPSPNPRVAEGRGGRNAQRGRNAGVNAQVRAQLLRQFEMLRERGASSEVFEQFLERMRDAGVNEIRTDDGRITIDDNGRITVRREASRDTLDTPGPRVPRDQ